MSEYEPQGQSEQQFASQRLVVAIADNISTAVTSHVPADLLISYMDKPAPTFSAVVQTNSDYWELASVHMNIGDGERQRRFFIERLVTKPDGTNNDIALRYDFGGNDATINELCTPYKKVQSYSIGESLITLMKPHEIEDAFAPLFDIKHFGGLPVVLPLFERVGPDRAERVLKQHYKFMRSSNANIRPQKGASNSSLLGRLSLKFWPK